MFIVGNSGHAYYSKFNKDKTKFAEFEIQISGFISALLMFSKEVIGKVPGSKLKEIDFGNRLFYINSYEGVIFAYFIEEQEKNFVIKRYMPLIAEEFLNKFKSHLDDFDGNVSRFRSFEEIVNHYLLI